jgi:hypothetical protein
MSNICNGTNDVPKLRESKAYCEGRAANAAGALLATNPHPTWSTDHTAWDLGHASWELDPAAGPGQDCCADAYGGGCTP